MTQNLTPSEAMMEIKIDLLTRERDELLIFAEDSRDCLRDYLDCYGDAIVEDVREILESLRDRAVNLANADKET